MSFIVVAFLVHIIQDVLAILSVILALLCCRTTKPIIMDTVLQNIGNTPLIRINHISSKDGIKCELCEWYCYILH